jgi:hypothetical protein
LADWLGNWTRVGSEGSPSRQWIAACALLVLPVAAIAHHGLFYPRSCILAPFGWDYDLPTITLWLSRDPSLYLAIVVAPITFALGQRFANLRWLVLPFVIAFAPLTLWIWDLPFTGGFICRHLHDGRALLADGVPLKSRHLYMLGAALYPVFLATSLRLRVAIPVGGRRWDLRRILLTLARSQPKISNA